MRKYFLIGILFLSAQLSAQNKLIFDTSKVNSNTKLIGRYHHADEKMAYSELNFIIEDPATIKAVLATLTLGDKRQNASMGPNFQITIVQDFNEIERWNVYPGFNNILFKGHIYQFDIKKIKPLAKKYPFTYKFETIPFTNKEEYEKYLNREKENKNFLFDYAPRFKYEGSFKIQFPRNQKFSSPAAVSDYLMPLIEQIVDKDDYLCGYALDEMNVRNLNQYTMTIQGSRKLYDTLQLENLKKQAWIPDPHEGWFFYMVK